MTTTTVFADPSDGVIISTDAVYATAAAGAGFTVGTTETIFYTGQIPGFFEIFESFVGFDTASIPDSDVVSAAVFSIKGFEDQSAQDYTNELRVFDWSTTVTSADWRTPAQLTALTLAASISTTAYSTAYMDFTSEAAFPAQINKTGFTRFVLASSLTRTSTAPSTSEYMAFSSGDNSGTADDPKLVITHAAGGTSATATPAVAALVLAAPAATGRGSGTRTPAATALVLTPRAPTESAGSRPLPAVTALVLTPQAPTPSAGSRPLPNRAITLMAIPAVSAGMHNSRSPAVTALVLTPRVVTYKIDSFRIPGTVSLVLVAPPPSLQSTSTVSVNLSTFAVAATFTTAAVPVFRVVALPTFNIVTTIWPPESVTTTFNVFNILTIFTVPTVTATVQPNQVTVAVAIPSLIIQTTFGAVSYAGQAAATTHAVPLPEINYATAIPPSVIQAATLGPITNVTARLEILNANGTVFMNDFDISAGSVTVSLDRDERRTIDIALYDPDNLIDHHPGGLWYDKIIVPYRGIRWKNHVWEAPLGRFYIDRISEPDFPHVVSITGRDQAKRLLADKLPYAISFSAAEAPEDVIRVIATNGNVDRLNLEVTGKTLGRDYLFERGTARWEIISKLAEAFSMEVFFDSNGYLVLRTFRDPVLTPSIWTFQTGPDVGNLASFTKSGDDSRLFNHIVVMGESTAQLPVTAEAENNLAGSASAIDLIGRRTYPYESSFVSTESQAIDLAMTLLHVMSLESYEMTFNALVASWLEVGEVVDIIDPEPWTGQPTRFLLTDFTIPIGLGQMSGTGKRVQLVR